MGGDLVAWVDFGIKGKVPGNVDVKDNMMGVDHYLLHSNSEVEHFCAQQKRLL